MLGQLDFCELMTCSKYCELLSLEGPIFNLRKKKTLDTCDVRWSSKISWNSQILIIRYSQTKQIISLFPIVFCNPSTARIFGTTWTFSVGSVLKLSFANVIYNQSEKLNLNLTDLRLILLDRNCTVYWNFDAQKLKFMSCLCAWAMFLPPLLISHEFQSNHRVSHLSVFKRGCQKIVFKGSQLDAFSP